MDAERRQAMIEGRGRYFTGRPCAHGHVAERGTVNGQCVECARLARQSERGREWARTANRRYYRKAHPEIKRPGRPRKPVMAVWRSAEPTDVASFIGSVPIVGTMAVSERADAARLSAQTGTLTTTQRKPITGTMAATDHADNAARPITGKLRTADPLDVARFMAWRARQSGQPGQP